MNRLFLFAAVLGVWLLGMTDVARADHCGSYGYSIGAYVTPTYNRAYYANPGRVYVSSSDGYGRYGYYSRPRISIGIGIGYGYHDRYHHGGFYGGGILDGHGHHGGHGGHGHH